MRPILSAGFVGHVKCALGVALLGAILPARAESTWHGHWDVVLHATAGTTQLQTDSVLNPGNTLARLSEDRQGIEARLDIKLESSALRLTLRPILGSQWHDHDRRDAGYLSQWQVRATLSDVLTLGIGREVMNWGPAQFRSPSSPFYFDNGRGDPTRELSGVDVVKLAWTPDAEHAVSLAYVEDSGHGSDATDPWRATWLLKGEWRGDDWTGGLALAQAAGRAPFAGAYGQWTLSEAWMTYAEAASSSQVDALHSPAESTRPFEVRRESARHSSVLLGVARSFANGQSLNLELLSHGHGYTPAEAEAYFARAATDPTQAALALSQRPALLGRRYLHAVWQSNPLDTGTYWRLMASHNLDDASRQWAAYLDRPIDEHLSVTLLGVVNTGGPRREFAALSERALTLGLRLALP